MTTRPRVNSRTFQFAFHEGATVTINKTALVFREQVFQISR